MVDVNQPKVARQPTSAGPDELRANLSSGVPDDWPERLSSIRILPI